MVNIITSKLYSIHLFTSVLEEQLIMICLDIFFGGAATTSNTIDFAFLIMILYPNVQRKIQIYIDEVIEKDKSISYSDRLRYTGEEKI